MIKIYFLTYNYNFLFDQEELKIKKIRVGQHF